MNGVKVVTGAAAAVLLLAFVGPAPALADTIEAALVRAYQNNPQLNAQRAPVRSTDENVPQALSGYRPKVAVTASAGYQYTDALSNFRNARPLIFTERKPPPSAGATVTQTLYNGNQTANKTRAAESQVSGAREGLRVLEQTILLSAATIYMDYLRDAAIVEVQRSNVRVLEQTLKQTRDRFNVGEVTRTDVAQSEAQLAAGKTQLLAAEANPDDDASEFPPHHRQRAGSTRAGLAGRSLLAGNAARRGRTQPDRKSECDGGDVRHRRQLSAGQGERGRAAADGDGCRPPSSRPIRQRCSRRHRSFSASAIAQVSVPVYQGGAEYSLIRQSKETLAQQRLVLEQTRDQTRANTVTAWGQLVAGKAQVASAQSQVTASEIALNGVREEAKAGQRTTLDVLNAQQALVNARVALVTAQHDRVVASYAVLERGGTAVAAGAQTCRPASTTRACIISRCATAGIGVRTPDGR